MLKLRSTSKGHLAMASDTKKTKNHVCNILSSYNKDKSLKKERKKGKKDKNKNDNKIGNLSQTLLMAQT